MIKIVFAFLAVLSGLAVIYDIKTFCIPNRLTGCGCICGLTYSLIAKGTDGIINSIAGIVLPVVIFMVLYVLNVIGAGDIKLFAAIGSFICYRVFIIAAVSLVLTAVYGLVLCLRKGGIFMNRTKIHMSVPIFIATMVYGICSLF